MRDTSGIVARLRANRSRMAIIAYGDELNSYVGQRMLELMRAGGDTVGFFRLWPMSGTASYDSARVVIGRAPTVIFAMNVRPIAAKGSIALPDSLARCYRPMSHMRRKLRCRRSRTPPTPSRSPHTIRDRNANCECRSADLARHS